MTYHRAGVGQSMQPIQQQYLPSGTTTKSASMANQQPLVYGGPSASRSAQTDPVLVLTGQLTPTDVFDPPKDIPGGGPDVIIEEPAEPNYMLWGGLALLLVAAGGGVYYYTKKK